MVKTKLPVNSPENTGGMEPGADMASLIPMYEEVHRLHAAILSDLVDLSDSVVLDIGGAGASFDAFCNQLQKNPPVKAAFAIENSKEKADELWVSHPWITVLHQDIQNTLIIPAAPNIVYLLYVLPYIKLKYHIHILKAIYSIMAPGGYLVIGCKDAPDTYPGITAYNEYIRFRLRNGHTLKERHDVPPMCMTDTEEMLKNAGFIEITETSRWLMFNTFIAYKST